MKKNTVGGIIYTLLVFQVIGLLSFSSLSFSSLYDKYLVCKNKKIKYEVYFKDILLMVLSLPASPIICIFFTITLLEKLIKKAYYSNTLSFVRKPLFKIKLDK